MEKLFSELQLDFHLDFELKPQIEDEITRNFYSLEVAT